MRNRTNGLAWGLCIWALIAASWYAIGLATAARLSASMDEVIHYAAGLSYLHHGDFRMNPEHPPLVKALAALPVYVLDPPSFDYSLDPEQEINWLWSHQHTYGTRMLFNQPDGRHWPRLMLARAAMLALGALGSLFVFLLGRELARHNAGGWCAATLLLFYPEYAGHAVYVTFDTPTVAAGAAIAWAGWRWWKAPTWRATMVFAGVCGVASQIKMPLVTFAAAQSGVLLVLALIDRRRGLVGRALGLVAATVLAGYVATWAGAGFRFAAIAPGESIRDTPMFLPPYANDGQPIWGLVSTLHAWHVLPENALGTLACLGAFSQRDQWLFGQHSHTGWPHYFLVTTAIKTPLPMLVGLIALVVMGARVAPALARRRTGRWRLQRVAILIVPSLVVAALVMASGINIGHRHFLIVYLPWSLYLGAWAGRALLQTTRVRWLAAALVASQVATLLWWFPHQATYFNSLGGGTPYAASSIITDSNVDLGQDLPLLVDWMRRNEIERINFAYFGLSDPEAYGIHGANWIVDRWFILQGRVPGNTPDPRLPTAISVFKLREARERHPGLFDCDPDVLLNSFVVYEAGL